MEGNLIKPSDITKWNSELNNVSIDACTPDGAAILARTVPSQKIENSAMEITNFIKRPDLPRSLYEIVLMHNETCLHVTRHMPAELIVRSYENISMLRGMTPEKLLEFQQQMKNDYDIYRENIQLYKAQSEDSLVGTGISR